MPENRKKYKLDEISQIGSSKRIFRADYVEKGIPFYRSKEIIQKSFNENISDPLFIDEQKYFKIKEKYGSPGNGDILISSVGNRSGIPYLVNNDGDFYFKDGNLLWFRNFDKEVYSPYLFQWLKSYIGQNLLLSSMIGSAQKALTIEGIKNLDITLPSFQEQKSIASILSALDDKIELNLQMNKTLEEMAMALYKHWFVDFGPFQDGEFVNSEFGEIPKGWEVKTLEDIIKFSNGYAFKSKQLLKEEEPDTFHIFKMGHIQKGGGLKADGTKSWIKKRDCKGLDKFILRTGDILMSMTDMKDNMTILGHTALMNENDKFIVNQRVGLLRVANNCGIDYPYVFLLTNSSDFIQRLRSQANSGVQVNLSTNAIKSAKVVVPNKEVNVKFNNITLPYYESINQNALENQTLTKLRDTLLPKLISGEVRVRDVEKTLSEVL